ncbi:hypothetical protein BDV27DRAFT_161825 [Aspergillus caelatus]|uniref:Up-regulated during septation protein 1 domain-containing protein n=1 Tax=Aspergillus caelatus TaxID=61420 RepID=A0A5N6ZSM8_9EURO|nr:uncharacterized protein BDV27DRAFT_161825 [Aspergillus caelatus]KAE8360253.1 hypothetical protein BDV27DRAFT_161825 [Aspergillus caelatus]
MDSPTIPGWYPINDDSSSSSNARSSENPFLKAILNPIPPTNALSNKRGYKSLSKKGGYPKYNYSKNNRDNSKSPANVPVLAKALRSEMGKPLPVLPTEAKKTPTMAPPQNSPTSSSCCYLTPQQGSKQLVYRCRRQLSSSTGSSLRRDPSPGRTPSNAPATEPERRSKIEYHVNVQKVAPTMLHLGVISANAHLTLPAPELNELRNHAKRQAEQLKVLSKHEVATLSQELVTMEEYCKYLQDRCISLKSDRRILQEQKIRDLTSATWIGPKWKGRMLEREQELRDIDISIDKWTGILEHAVKNRVSIRHRLLEHIAAILAVESPTVLPSQYLQFSTNTIPGSSEMSQQRIQSIPIFADSALFTAAGYGSGMQDKDKRPLPLSSGTPLMSRAQSNNEVELTEWVTEVKEDSRLPRVSQGGKRVQKSEYARLNDLWAPFCLRRQGLLLFLATFVTLLAALVGTYIASDVHNGLGSVNEKNYYLWTYGPTAVFMIVGAFWARVQYRISQLMPWILMLKGPQTGTNSVLLDYASDWFIVSLYISIKNKHYLVSLAVLGTLLLTGTTIFSTGLLAYENIHYTEPAQMHITQSFNGSHYDPSLVDGRPFELYLGNMNFNASTPLGLNGNNIFPSFYEAGEGSSVYPVGDQYQAMMDVFTMDTGCEDASFTTKSQQIEQGDNITTVVVSHPHQNCSFSFTQGDLQSAVAYPDKEYIVITNVGGCAGQIHPMTGSTIQIGDIRQIDWRLWTIVLHQDLSGAFIDSGIHVSSSGGIESNGTGTYDIKAIACTPKYTLNKRKVDIWRGQNTSVVYSNIHHDGAGENYTIPGVSAADILYGVWKSLWAMENPPDGGLLIQSNGKNTEEFWNTTHLKSLMEQDISGVGAALVQEYLLQSDNKTAHGLVTNSEKRLVVQSLSFGLLTSILVLLIAITASLALFYHPISACPRDAGSLAGLATILARSPEFSAQLMGMGPLPVPQIQDALQGQRFHTQITPDGSFSITPDDETERHAPSPVEVDISWWRPFAVRIPARVLIFSVPIAFIIVLEVLYQHSQKFGGIGHAGDQNSYIKYTWYYLPALAMLGVRVLYQILENCTRTFHPYSQLCEKVAQAESSVSEDFNGQLSLHVFATAIRRRYWALAAASLSVLVSFSLSIAVSGLYTVDVVTSTIEANAIQLTNWAWADSTKRAYWDRFDYSSKTPGLIIDMGLSYPQWTYKDLAFPRIELNETFHPNGSIDVRLPAVRADINCEVMPQNQYNWTYNGNLAGQSGYMAFNFSGLDNCGFVTKGLDALSPKPGDYFRYMTNGVETNASIVLDPTNRNCPTRLMVYGKASSSTVESLYILRCRPRLKQLQVEARLSVPSYMFDDSKPPSIIPNSTTTLLEAGFVGRDDYSGKDNEFHEAIPPNSDLYKYFFNVQTDQPSRNSTQMDMVTNNTMRMKNVTAEDLLDDPSLYIDGMQTINGIVTAQLLNLGAHLPTNQTSDRISFPAHFIEKQENVIQSPISTRIIEGVLAVMVICGLVAVTYMDKRCILPKNPTSIAASASLLAGSELVEKLIPPGSEWCDDRELKKRGIFDDNVYSMRWWAHDEGKRYGIDIVRNNTPRDGTIV